MNPAILASATPNDVAENRDMESEGSPDNRERNCGCDHF
jgi:hypothetical protein